MAYSRSILCRAKAANPCSREIIISATNTIYAITTSQMVCIATQQVHIVICVSVSEADKAVDVGNHSSPLLFSWFM
jgi:hypothetical protein